MADSVAELSKPIALLEQKVRSQTALLEAIVTLLSEKGRQEHEAELLKSLQGFETELENITSLLRDSKVGEFKAKAAFLRVRFLDGGLG